ncbi:unnamed protein product [Adineta steineri]|uniref:Uncharacterized protein n=1 Tax=Adineta steineri TaxID=433720 RepID=A0A819GTV2_9BILA|nr:unnamed protein product [Adineta steineri]
MGQPLTTANTKLVEFIKSNDFRCNSKENISNNDINLLLTIIDTTNLKTQWIKQIQKKLNLLTMMTNFEMINNEIDNIFLTNAFVSIIDDYKQTIKDINDIRIRQEQLRLSFIKHIDEDKNFSHPTISRLVTQFQSLENNSSTRNIKVIEKLIENIFVNFSTNIISFKNVLSLLKQLTFDTINIYSVRNVLADFTKTFSNKSKNIPPNELIYLTLTDTYPTKTIRQLHKNQFTGQFIATFILAHIDFHNTINDSQQSAFKSISYEFHPQVFKELFEIIKQLTIVIKKDSNKNLVYILFFYLRLFITHLKILSTISRNLPSYPLIVNNEDITTDMDISSTLTDKEFDLCEFETHDILQNWLDTLLILACNEQIKVEEISICQEASKTIIYILNLKAISFTEKLKFIFKYVNENKYPILIEQLLNELNTNISLLNWINVLCDSNNEESEKIASFKILCSFIDIYLNSPNDIRTQRIEQILKTFQQLLLIRLASELVLTTFSFISKYLNYILINSKNKLTFMNDILVGLCLMTETENKFDFTIIQPIFITVLPLIAEFSIQNSDNQEIIYWLIGKMSRILLTGSLLNPLEMKYIEKLQSPLFAGGCERISLENNSYLSDLFISNIASYSQCTMTDYPHGQSSVDQDFLMSVYKNTDEGARLISKMKLHIKDKRCLLQKSIEQQANEACAALFAVYIKHYRRINLAKYELLRNNDEQPHSKLLSIFEYANRSQIIFGIRKGQGDDCNELYKQIKIKSYFLLFAVKEGHLMPIITNINDQRNLEKTNKKSSFRLLRNIFQACIRFKNSIVIKKKFDNEDILHRAINTYIYDNLIGDGSQLEVNELLQCMIQQFERAITRLITYRFVQNFILKIFNIEDKNRIISFLTIYPFFLRNINLNWSYLENILAINIQMKEDIANNYYSIIKTTFSYLLQSTFIDKTILERNTFSLLNLYYTSSDIDYLHRYEFIELLFQPFVHSIELSDIKITGYYWFQLYILKLCENFKIKQDYIFSNLIFNELNECNENSKQNDVDIEFNSNQWLQLLLCCVYSYEHIRSLCSTYEYIEKLLNIYRNSHNQTTIILALKILRKLIIFLPENTNDNSMMMIKNFLNEILLSQNRTSDIFTELIYIYRSIITHKSAWQIMAIELIFHTIIEGVKSLESKQINNILTALCILGGYIQPFCLGSAVQVYVNSEMDSETRLAVIMKIDTKSRDLNEADARPYFVHYSDIDQTEWINADKLRIEIDVPSPNLLKLPISMENIYSLFDALVYFIEIDISLELKRRSIATLYRLLTNKKLVEMFLEKSYASIIVKLSTADLLSKHRQQPLDLRLWSKRHLEQYCLSLDRCESMQQIIEDTNITNNNKSLFTVWTDVPFTKDEAIMNSFSNNISQSYQWKPTGTKREIQLYKRGRIGNENIEIVSMPYEVPGERWFIDNCGTIHGFPGRLNFSNTTAATSLATFIIDNLQFNEGKWYFCVRLIEGAFAQIGWATQGFQPSNTIGIGNDQYSWSYDGYQGMLYNNGEYPFLSDVIQWNRDDVCGCGIEIDGDQTRISYWFNGMPLGTPFTHHEPIGSTTTICNMLPNRHESNYFPGITLKVTEASAFASCELIFHPEEMIECPLPEGYKPLLMPILIIGDDTLVSYPYSAYLIDNYIPDYIYRPRNDYSTIFLRDFINDHHLKTTMICDDDNHQLILPENSGGFPLTIDHHGSLTISFDFEILTQLENCNIPLLIFDTPETLSIDIPSSNINDKVTHVTIVFQTDDQQIKIYINNTCRTLYNSIISPFDLHILPTMKARIQNLAIWHYALSEDLIHRLFTFSLSYVGTDYHKLNEYRKQVNSLTFSNDQTYFPNGLLVPFNEPFDEKKWEEKKKHTDEDESKYFKPIIGTNQSTIQLFGNETYLVLEKSIEPYSVYTFILDISIDNLPKINEQITLLIINEQTEIFITHDAQLCLSLLQKPKLESKSKFKLNEYVRILISVDEKSIKIYMDGLLELDTIIDNDQLTIKDKKIELFREYDVTKNTTNVNTLRIECKSVTYLNRATDEITDEMKSSNNLLEKLIVPPYPVMSPSLLLIGYDESQIKSTMNKKSTANIQVLDTIIRENISWKFARAINKEKLKDLLKITEFDTDEKIASLADIMLANWNDIRYTPSPAINTTNPLFSQAINHLNIDNSLTEWIQDKLSKTEEIDFMNQLIDLNQFGRDNEDQRKKIQKSIQYSHHQITRQHYSHIRSTCESGLISIYAHYTILNMLKVWSNDGSSLFPLEKLGDCTLIVALIRLLDYHYNYTRLHTDENIDRTSLLINSILTTETNELLKHEKITQDILSHNAPILYRLQMSIIVQSIQLLSNSSVLLSSCDYSDQSMIKQPNLNFILKIINLFIKLIQDKLPMKQDDVNTLVPILFPVPLINLLYDLFLMTPTHQSKINILHIFSTLIQSSNEFYLCEHIRKFLFCLFNELSSKLITSQAMKTFQSTLLDLVYLIFEKKDGAIQSDFSSLFQDLLVIIDVINVLNDKTKQTSFPEAFLLQLQSIFHDDIQLIKDQTEKSNTYFDTIVDLQLMNYMNNHPLVEFETTELINTLPMETTPDSTYYKTYPSLWHIPTIYIQNRAKIFHLFTKYIEKLLAIIDFSQVSGESPITDKIRTAKQYILYSTKLKHFNRAIDASTLETVNDIPSINFDTIKASINDEQGLQTMFNQAYEQLHDSAHIVFRRSNAQLWRAQYLEMHSTDQGGPYRDSISCMCSDLNSTQLSLFILCPNGRTNNGLNRDRWIPNVYPPNQPISNRIKKQYRFVGQLMGMAIRKKHYLDLKFPSLLWKQLVRETITTEDIEGINVQSFTIIDEIEKIIKQSSDADISNNDLIRNTLDELRFEVVCSSGQTYELIPGGKDFPVTILNFKEYSTSYREFRLNEFYRQIEFIRQGLYSIVPGYFLGLFTADELEEAVCGKGNMDIELLKRNTVYGGDHDQDSPLIEQFWIILRDMFTEEQKKLFLKFVWGRCTLPNRDDDFTSSFQIDSYDVPDGEVDGALPTAHTCSFALDLPSYSSIDIMYDRLNYAITYCSSIDGDGNLNEAAVLTDFQ